jgi:hypothetical protein
MPRAASGRGLLRQLRRVGFVALAAFSQRHLCTVCAVGGEDSVEPSEVDPGFGHQRDQSRNDVQDALMSRAQDAQERLKSIGSKMMCVVPSRYGVLSS